jgi:RNA polymerase sigma factor (sigma-70 family)
VAIDVSRREAVRAADPLETVAPGESALITTPESAEAVYDVWAVREAVAQLPADEQEIVRLQHFDGLTHAEIGQQLGLPVGTVKSRSFRAHKKLATLLGHLRE